MRISKEDKCMSDYVWSWSRDKAKEYRQSCKKTKDCINLTKKGIIYNREQCVNITKTFNLYLVKSVITGKNINILTTKKSECFDVCLKDWKDHMEEKYKTDFKGKMTESAKKKLRKAVKDLREKFVEKFYKLNLTKFTFTNLKEISKSNKELDYQFISDLKREQQRKKDMKKLRREIEFTNLLIIFK